MIDKHLAVRDMPDDVREACAQRGISPRAEMSIKDAMGEWAAWHIGDSAWGIEAAEHIADMAKRLIELASENGDQ